MSANQITAVSGPTLYRIPVNPSRYADETDTWNSKAVLRVGRNRFTFGFVGPEGTARRVTEGPVLPGPYAYATPQCTVIAAGGNGTGAESARMRAEGSEADADYGDIVELRGYRFRIRKTNNDNIALDLIDPELDIRNVQAGDVLDGSSSNLRVVEVKGLEDGRLLHLKVTMMRHTFFDGPSEGQPYDMTLDLERHPVTIAQRPGYQPAPSA